MDEIAGLLNRGRTIEELSQDIAQILLNPKRMIFYSKQLGVYMAAAAGVWTRCLTGVIYGNLYKELYFSACYQLRKLVIILVKQSLYGRRNDLWLIK